MSILPLRDRRAAVAPSREGRFPLGIFEGRAARLWDTPSRTGVDSPSGSLYSFKKAVWAAQVARTSPKTHQSKDHHRGFGRLPFDVSK